MNQLSAKSKITPNKGWGDGERLNGAPTTDCAGGGATKRGVSSRDGVNNKKLVDGGRTYKKYENTPTPAFSTTPSNTR